MGRIAKWSEMFLLCSFHVFYMHSGDIGNFVSRFVSWKTSSIFYGDGCSFSFVDSRATSLSIDLNTLFSCGGPLLAALSCGSPRLKWVHLAPLSLTLRSFRLTDNVYVDLSQASIDGILSSLCLQQISVRRHSGPYAVIRYSRRLIL